MTRRWAAVDACALALEADVTSGRVGAMTTPRVPVLEFPEMLYGQTEDIIREVRTQGRSWAREYLETGAFSQPRRMLPVPPGELLVMDPVGHFDVNLRPRWQVHLFTNVFMSLSDGAPKEERQ
jgi:hypothetical protein